jgi:hypothetical protein
MGKAVYACSESALLETLTALFHFESEKRGFGTARCRCFISAVPIELITAFVQRIDLGLAFLFLLIVLRQAACGESTGQSAQNLHRLDDCLY